MYLNKGKKAKGGGKKDKRPKVNLKDYEDPPLSLTSREHVSKIIRNSGHPTKARGDKAKTKKLGASTPFTLAMKRLNEVTGPKASSSTSSSSRDGMTHHQVVVRTDPEEEALVAKQLAEEAETEREFLAKVDKLVSGSTSKPLANTVIEERVHQPSASNPFRYPLTFGTIMVKNIGLINPDDSDFKKKDWNIVFVNQCLEEYTAEVLCVHEEKQIVRAEDLKEYWRLLAKGRLLKGLFKEILADSLYEAYKAAIKSKEIMRRSVWVESVLNHGKRSQFGSLFDFEDLGPAPLGGRDAKDVRTSGNAASGKTPQKKKLLLSVSSSDEDRDDDPLDFEDDEPAKSTDGEKGKLADYAPGTPLKKRKVTTPVQVFALDEEEDDFDDAKLLAQRKAAFAAAQKELRALEMRVERRKAAEKAEREAAAKAAQEAAEKAAREAAEKEAAEKEAAREAAEKEAAREAAEKVAAREAEEKAAREAAEKAKVEAEKKPESEASGVVAQPVLVKSADSEKDEIGRVLQLHSQLGKAIYELVEHLQDSGKA